MTRGFKLKVTMISNYMNHHIKPLCDSLFSLSEGNFCFIATNRMREFRKKLGYSDLDDQLEYIVQAYDESDYRRSIEICKNSDVLILGNVSKKFPLPDLRKDQVGFVYSERLFKDKMLSLKNMARYIKYVGKRFEYRNMYLLCASSYAADDYRLTGNFINKAYKWGYFPEVIHYEEAFLLESKNHQKIQILWVGRLIGWKHPEFAIEVAQYLKNNDVLFEMNVIGNGELEETIKKRVKELNLDDCVHILGALDQFSVRKYMENANIFLFTSDRNEGWGAVLNEAMNAGCAVIASKEAGSTCFLVDDLTGIVYSKNDVKQLCNACFELCNSYEIMRELGMSAYQRINNVWNGKEAASRFLVLVDCIRNNKTIPFEDGPCSRL